MRKDFEITLPHYDDAMCAQQLGALIYDSDALTLAHFPDPLQRMIRQSSRLDGYIRQQIQGSAFQRKSFMRDYTVAGTFQKFSQSRKVEDALGNHPVDALSTLQEYSIKHDPFCFSLTQPQTNLGKRFH